MIKTTPRLNARWVLFGKMLVIAVVDALTTQLFIDLGLGEFRVSLSVVVLPVLLYLNPKVNPLWQTAVIMSLGLLSRTLFNFGIHDTWLEAIRGEYHTLIFEAVYGSIYYVFFYRNPKQTIELWSGVILAADFLSNTFELLFRFSLNETLILQNLPVLFLIATIRSASAIVLLLSYRHYRTLIKREEHQKRYERLTLIASQLSAENYLMQKNMKQIETVMYNAYALYEELQVIDHKGAREALTIAKEVHEIKKSYAQVMRGLSTLTDTEAYEVQSHMELIDLINILKHSLLSEWEGAADLPIQIDCNVNIVIKEHFLLLSVLRNLAINALEALKEKPHPHLVLRFSNISDRKNKQRLQIEIIDNGQGIKEKDVACIYEPGFSTKFSPETGDIQRGLGLTLVKEIVENNFNGTITVSSIEGLGTTFHIDLDTERMGAE